MRQRTTILVNLLTNQGTVLVDILVNLFVLGYLTRNLSRDEFGLVVLALSLGGIFELLGASLNKGTIRHIAVANEQSNRSLSGSLVAASLILYTGLGFACSVTAGWLSFNVNHYFEVPAAHQADASLAFTVVAIGVLFCFPLSVFRGALHASQKHYLVNGARLFPVLLRGALIPLAFWFLGPSITAVLVITFVCRFLERISWYLIYRRCYRGIAIRLHGLGKVAFKMLLGFSVFAVLIDIGNIMGYEAYKYLIGSKLSLADAGLYGIYATLVSYSGTMARTASNVLMPVASKYTARGDAETNHRVLLQGTKVTVLLNLLFCTASLPLLYPLLNLWAGEEMAKPWHLAAILLSGQIIVGYSTCAGVLLAGSGRQTYLAITTVLCFAIGLAVAYGLTLWTAVSLLDIVWVIVVVRSVNAILRIEYALRYLATKPHQILLQGIALPTIVALLTAGAIWLTTRPFVIDTILKLAMASTLTLLLYGVLAIMLCLTKSERDNFYQRLARRGSRIA